MLVIMRTPGVAQYVLPRDLIIRLAHQYHIIPQVIIDFLSKHYFNQTIKNKQKQKSVKSKSNKTKTYVCFPFFT